MSIPSLYSGLSGLSAHQRMLDVVGHNIANVNTRGFKSYSLRITENISSRSSLPSPLAPIEAVLIRCSLAMA